MPDLTDLVAGLIVAFSGGLLVVPCCYLSRRKEMRLRSPRGALGWALVDGYQAWLVLTIGTVGFWLSRRFFSPGGVAFITAMVFIIVGLYMAARTAPAVARQTMRILNA